MDGGDCGIDVVYQNVAGFRLDADNQTIEFPYLSPLDQKPLAALYINLTSVIPQDEEISEASYAKSPLIRTAIISQKNKVSFTLWFLFLNNQANFSHFTTGNNCCIEQK